MYEPATPCNLDSGWEIEIIKGEPTVEGVPVAFRDAPPTEHELAHKQGTLQYYGKCEEKHVFEKPLLDLTAPIAFEDLWGRLEPLFAKLRDFDRIGLVCLQGLDRDNLVIRGAPPHFVAFKKLDQLISYDDLFTWPRLLGLGGHLPPEFEFAKAFDNFYRILSQRTPDDRTRYTLLDFINADLDKNYELLYAEQLYGTKKPTFLKETSLRAKGRDSSTWQRFGPEQRLNDILLFFQANPYRVPGSHSPGLMLTSEEVITPEMYEDFAQMYMRNFAKKINTYFMGLLLIQMLTLDMIYSPQPFHKKHPQTFTRVSELVADLIAPSPLARLDSEQALGRYTEIKV